MVREDPKFLKLTKEQEQEMKEEVLALCQNKKVGAHPTNQLAAIDYRRHLTALNDEVSCDITTISSEITLKIYLIIFVDHFPFAEDRGLCSRILLSQPPRGYI
jgi:hypothetical protein